MAVSFRISEGPISELVTNLDGEPCQTTDCTQIVMIPYFIENEKHSKTVDIVIVILMLVSTTLTTQHMGNNHVLHVTFLEMSARDTTLSAALEVAVLCVK